MKSFNKLLILSLLPILLACEKVSEIIPDDVNKEQPEIVTPAVPEGRTISVSATSDGPATKTTLAETSVLWDEGDKFSIVNVGTNVVMTLSGEAGSTHGDFSGTVAEKDVIDDSARAIFPSSAFSSFVDGNITLSIPQHQTYIPGSFDHGANIMVGEVTATGTDSYSASFKNMMGVLKLSLTGDCKVKTITIFDQGEKSLCGTATFASSSWEDGITTDSFSNGESSIILDCGDGAQLSQEPVDFYIVVPVGAFSSGFRASITTTDGQKDWISTSKDNTVARNSIKRMPSIAVAPSEIAEVDIENDAVKAFRGYGIYNAFGETSHFTNYNSALTKYVDQDNPQSYSITWSGGSSVSYTISFSDVTSGRVFSDRTVKGTKYDLINLVPGHEYTYTVKSGSQIVKKGSVRATGKIRMVTISDSWNCRDLGGWTGLGNHEIKYEWLYRTGSLNGVCSIKPGRVINKYSAARVGNPDNYSFSAESKQQLMDMGIMAELDLRYTSNEKTDTDRIHAYSLDQDMTGIPGWMFFRIPTSDAVANPLSNPGVVRDVAWIVDQVLNKKNPVAFHCKSGADRTGTVALIIEALLGVDPGAIAFEYELTNFSHEQSIVIATSELRDRRADGKADNKELYNFQKTLFVDSSTKLPGTNWQEKAYYYLNQTFASSGKAISSTDLDNFIKFMLDLDSYEHPSWATTNSNSLESIYQ